MTQGVPGDDKKTGFTFQGKEVVLQKTRGRPRQEVRTQPGLVNDKKRIEALAVYCVTGKDSEVQRLTGVATSTLKEWKKQQWWIDGLEEMRNENDHQFDAAFTNILEKVIGSIDDRLVNGDEVILKDGSRAKRQVSMRDLVGALAYTIDKRQLLRGKPTTRSESVSTESRLNKLVDHFTNLSKKGAKEAEQAPKAAPVVPSAPQPAVVEDVPLPAIK